MTEIRTIRARASERAINKVTRMFNASLRTILQELLQNSRRSGATHISLSTPVDDNRSWLCIADDGEGIQNPEILLTFGESDWESVAVCSEDPAGMGFFSLAQRGGRICSRDWLVELQPEHFTGQASAVVVPCHSREGTAIFVPLKDGEEAQLEFLIGNVAEFYPLSVDFNGDQIVRRDFLANALYRESWNGLDFGVTPSHSRHDSRINFFGITLTEDLPVVSQVDYVDSLTVHINVVDCPQLKLVLPARQELVQDAFLDAVRQQGLRVIYRYLATLDEHRLPYSKWQEAQSLGIELPEPPPQLYPYEPKLCDYNRGSWHDQEIDLPEHALIIDFGDAEAYVEQVFWRGFAQAGLNYTLVRPVRQFAGYRWYDRIPVISSYQLRVTVDGEQLDWQPFKERYQGEKLIEADLIEVLATVETLDGTEQLVFPTDTCFLVNEWGCVAVEDIPICFSKDATIDPDELAELLEDCFFTPSEEFDADSYETQRDRFQEEAMKHALSLLASEKQAVEAQIRMILEREMVCWLLPNNWRAEVRISRGGYTVTVHEG